MRVRPENKGTDSEHKMPKREMVMKKAIMAIHLDAGRDTNGNPRRIFVVFDSKAEVIDAIDEGYQGSGGVIRKYGKIPISERFETSPSARRELMRKFE
jgi:hypothetical protein